MELVATPLVFEVACSSFLLTCIPAFVGSSLVGADHGLFAWHVSRSLPFMISTISFLGLTHCPTLHPFPNVDGARCVAFPWRPASKTRNNCFGTPLGRNSSFHPSHTRSVHSKRNDHEDVLQPSRIVWVMCVRVLAAWRRHPAARSASSMARSGRSASFCLVSQVLSSVFLLGLVKCCFLARGLRPKPLTLPRRRVPNIDFFVVLQLVFTMSCCRRLSSLVDFIFPVRDPPNVVGKLNLHFRHNTTHIIHRFPFKLCVSPMFSSIMLRTAGDSSKPCLPSFSWVDIDLSTVRPSLAQVSSRCMFYLLVNSWGSQGNGSPIIRPCTRVTCHLVFINGLYLTIGVA